MTPTAPQIAATAPLAAFAVVGGQNNERPLYGALLKHEAASMTYRIGQTLPPANVPQITTGPDMPPVWHCVLVPPQCEAKARAYFRARDIFAFYPSWGQKRWDRFRKEHVEWERPHIPGHLYVQFRHQPQWHVLKARRIISGIMTQGARPVAIHPDVIRHLQGLTVEAERLAAAKAEMMRVREGDTAEIIAGPLAGLAVEVTRITGDEAWLNLPFGGRVKASIKSLARKV
jgi:transcription antitermination factor NusG